MSAIINTLLMGPRLPILIIITVIIIVINYALLARSHPLIVVLALSSPILVLRVPPVLSRPRGLPTWHKATIECP